MRKKSLYFIIGLLILSISFSAHAFRNTSNRKSDNNRQKSSKYIQSEAGLNVPKVGVAIDAYYDPRLDNLVSGLKVLNVSVTNRSGNIIYFYPKKDSWRIVDHIGKTHKASNHLRFANKEAWNKFPSHIKQQLEYPRAVSDGNSVNFNLFFKSSVELSYFREIWWKSSALKKTFHIRMFSEQNAEGSNKEIPIPETIKLNPPLTAEEIRNSKQDPEKLERTSDPVVIPRGFDPSLDDFSIPVGD